MPEYTRIQWLKECPVTTNNLQRALVGALSLLICAALAGCGGDNNEDGNNDNNTDPTPDMAMEMGADMSADAGEDMEPMVDTIQIEGLSAPVTVRLDDVGVLYLECATNDDCFAAQGYMHAKHRFFAMDIVRRQTRGQLATAIGFDSALNSDRRFRHLMTTRDGTRLEDAFYDELNEQTRSMVQAYTRGVNAFLTDEENDEYDARLSNEYNFPLINKEIRPWEPQDTIAVYMQLAYQLGERSSRELQRTEALMALGEEASQDIFTPRSGTTATVYDSAGVTQATSLPGQPPNVGPKLRERLTDLQPARSAITQARKNMAHATAWGFGPQLGDKGSNNWAAAPSQTTSGNALLANDPHLTLNNPAIWHYVVLDAETNGTGDIHVAGASIPSVPGIVVGHNGSVAWGVTTTRYDMSDVYVETLNEDGTAVIFNGEEVPLIQKDFTFGINGKDDVTETFEWVPHHGPLISKDVENQRGVSVRWVAAEAGDDINFILELMRANNVGEAKTALTRLRSLAQNWVLADADGSIAWYPHSWIPRRPWASMDMPHWLSLPGDGTAEWDGFLTGEDVPQITDPPSGFIATANADFDGSYTDGNPFNDGHVPWQWIPTPGYRQGRINALLSDGAGSHTIETMEQIQADVYMEYAEDMVPQILMTATMLDPMTLSDEANAVVDALDAWNYTCPTGLAGTDPAGADPIDDMEAVAEAAGCSAFHVLIKQLTELIFGDELAALDDYDAREEWFVLQRALHQIFVEPNTLNSTDYFDDTTSNDEVEDRAAIVAEGLEATAEELEDLFESTAATDWLWGRIHSVVLTSFFAQAGTTSFNSDPFANNGGYETVNVAIPNRAGNAPGDFDHVNGASLRVVFELGQDGITTRYQLPGGQIHLRNDDRYLGLLDDWLTNTSRELPYTFEDVEASATESFIINP